MQTSTTDSPQNRLRVTLLTIGTLFALSPVLFDWAVHLRDFPSARYAALFPVLFLIGLRGRPSTLPRGDGYLWLLAALVIEVICIGGGFPRWGRMAVPVAIIGLCRATGVTSLRGAILMLWFVPVPHFLESLIWPAAVLSLIETAGWPLPSFELQDLGQSLMASKNGLHLIFEPSDAGLTLMAAVSGFAYFVGWRKGEPTTPTLQRMLKWVLVSLPVQALAVFSALLLLEWGQPTLGRWLLNYTAWWLGALFILIALVRGQPMHDTSDHQPDASSA